MSSHDQTRHYTSSASLLWCLNIMCSTQASWRRCLACVIRRLTVPRMVCAWKWPNYSPRYSLAHISRLEVSFYGVLGILVLFAEGSCSLEYFRRYKSTQISTILARFRLIPTSLRNSTNAPESSENENECPFSGFTAGPSAQAQSQAQTQARSIEECLNLLSAGFLRGGVGFLKGGTGMTQNLARDVRVGVTMVRVY